MDKETQAAPGRSGSVGKQMRGSVLLLTGRLVSVGLNFLSQILIVAYLTKEDFGAFSLALSAVIFCQAFSTLGLKSAIPRFVPLFHERERYGELFGTIALTMAAILGVGVAVIAFVHLAPSAWLETLVARPEAIAVLAVLCFLIPLEALDLTLVNLFASFGKPSSIFFRKHLLGPGLKLSAVLIVRALDGGILSLAYGYLFGQAVGSLVSLSAFATVLRQQDLLRHLGWGRLRAPFRDLFSFSLPSLASDLVPVAMHSVNVLMLGYFMGPAEVAVYAVVFPAARLNRLVLSSSTALFTPGASRLLARGEIGKINDLYWQTTIWMTALTFPLFALTFSMSQPLTTFLYGDRYAQSALILSILSLGYFFNVALGCNGHTLKVFGRMRFVVLCDLSVIAASLVANLLLIPRFGALGAAASTASTMVLHNALRQWGLGRIDGMRRWEPRYLTFYLACALSALALALAPWLGVSNIYAASALVGAASLAVVLVTRKLLRIESTFPELMRIPLIRHLLA